MDEDERITRLIADYVLEDASFTLINEETGEEYQSSKNLKVSDKINIKSQYNFWQYPNGVIHMAMMDLYELTGEEKYRDFPVKNYDFFFSHVDYLRKLYEADIRKWSFHLFFRMFKLDDCGALASGMIEIYPYDQRPEYRAYIDSTAMLAMVNRYRLADGTWAKRNPHDATVWLDDLFMGVPFLARMGDWTGKQEYFDFAAKQVIQFRKYLYNPVTELYHHNYYADLDKQGVAHWGRANGWGIMAQTNLLEYLPEDHPKRDTLLAIFMEQILGYSRYQSETGLWHQIINRNDSYLETSVSAMFTYAVAKGVNEGWIDLRYRTIAFNGWKGVKSKIDENGALLDVCEQTPTSDNMIFYYKRPAPYNDFHGTGAAILAGIEIMKLKEKMRIINASKNKL